MSNDLNTLFTDFLRHKNLSNDELTQAVANIGAGEGDRTIRDEFFEYCLGRGVAFKNYDVFESNDFDALRRIVLSAPDHIDYDDYWQRTSEITAAVAVRELGLTPSSVTLDFGCGVGRVAREVLRQVPCRLVGVDISRSMLTQAERYVASPHFQPLDSRDFHANPAGAGPFTAGYALIVLQHCADPQGELRAIQAACVPGARLLIANATRRFVPTHVGWVDDGLDIRAMIEAMFTVEKEIPMADVAAARFDPQAEATSDEQHHFMLIVRNP